MRQAKRGANQDSQVPWALLVRVVALAGTATAGPQGLLVNLRRMAWWGRWARQVLLVLMGKTVGWAHQACLVPLAVTAHQARTARTAPPAPRANQVNLAETGSQASQELLCRARRDLWARQALQGLTARVRRWGSFRGPPTSPRGK